MRNITGMRTPRGSSRALGVTAAIVIVSALVLAPVAQEPQRRAAADWPTYNRDLAGTRYSPLNQINTRTVSSLREIWSYQFHPEDGFIEGPSPTELFQQVTPIVVDGVMYLAAGNRVVALEPETGEEIWRHELTEGLASFRGVTYWPGAETHGPRIFFTTLWKLVALDAETGERDPTFGNQGEVELRIPYAGVPVVYDDILVLGSNAYGPGGEHIAPHLNQPRGGGRTIESVSARDRRQDRRAPLGVPHHPSGDRLRQPHLGREQLARSHREQRVGVHAHRRRGAGPRLHAGEWARRELLRWRPSRRQPLWELDCRHRYPDGRAGVVFSEYPPRAVGLQPPPAPGLFEIERDGERIPALAQVGKSAFMFILNRETGEPVHGVEERPVPAGDVPGEQYSPTQPIPLKPPPVARVSIGRDDIVTADDTTAEHAAACRELWDTVGYYNEGPYTPLRLQADGTSPSLVFPGISGGVNWGGTAYDPELGFIFVNSKDQPVIGWMHENPEYGPDTDTQVPYVRTAGPPFEAPIVDDDGTRLGSLPCFKPPWARLFAVNASTGEIAWEAPLGINELLPEGKQRVGSPSVGGPIVTAGGLVFIGATTDRLFRAFDSRTGEELWSAAFDYNVRAVPMTYAGSDGKQYLAANVSAPATGEPRGNERLVVFGLPDQ